MVSGIRLRLRCTMLLGNTPDDKLYRVQVHSDTNNIEVSCIGIDRVDAEAEGMYCSANELPLWLQERLAVLMMTDWRPVTEIVEDVGRRIDETTYWVVKPN
jgi:hypothetical protein